MSRLGGFVGRRVFFICLLEFKRIGKGWWRVELDLKNVCLVNIGFVKIFFRKLEVRFRVVEDLEMLCVFGLLTTKGRSYI